MFIKHKPTIQSPHSSVQFSCSVMSNSLRRHDCRKPCLPVHHEPLEFTQTHVHWVGDAILPSHPLSSPLHLPSIFPSISIEASASVLPMSILDWFPLGLTSWISLQSKGISRDFSSHSLKASVLRSSAFFMVELSHQGMTTGKTIALARRTFVGKVMSLLFNMLSRLVIAFLPRTKRLVISWL